MRSKAHKYLWYVQSKTTHFRYERLERGKDVLIVHLGADIVATVDAEVPMPLMSNKPQRLVVW